MIATPSERDAIVAGLEPLFTEATAKGLWFYSKYAEVWFSPRQLRAQHSKGSFLWGAVNWELRDPQAMVIDAEAAVARCQGEVTRIKALIESERRAVLQSVVAVDPHV